MIFEQKQGFDVPVSPDFKDLSEKSVQRMEL